jgi:hypothetical protein
MQLPIATMKNSSHEHADIDNIHCNYLWDLLMSLTHVTTIIVATCQIVSVATVKLCSSGPKVTEL